MTRKDYVAFAKLIKSFGPQLPIEFVEQVCDLFAADNSRFDTDKFVLACEWKESEYVDPRTADPVSGHHYGPPWYPAHQAKG